MAHLTRAELLRVPLASLSRIKEVRCHDLFDYSLRDFFLQGDGRPVVEARQAWGLILPKGSLITPRLLGTE